MARRTRALAPWLALLPMALTVAVAYVGATLWTLRVSLSSSRTFPTHDFVGLEQYRRLFDNDRWLHALNNLALYGTLVIAGALLVGTLLAVLIDRGVRAEGALRTVFLYPYALSFVATGLIWQWLLNPASGLQQVVRGLGFEGFEFDWIVDPERAIFTVAIAGTWQSAGLVMALVLAALRGVDDELWKAARVEGIPTWRVYVSIVLPSIAPALATAFVLLFTAAIKVFDTVVAMTQGGPGIASDVPAKFIMDHLFARANIALASAGAIVLLCTGLALAAPWWYWRSRQAAAGARG